MTKPILLRLVTFMLALGGLTSALAAVIDAPVPENAFISKDGLDWAWANPLPGADLTYQSQFGWRLPTLEELESAPLATDFMFDGANVPLGGSDPVSGATFQATNAALTGPAACATPYFTPGSYTWCDWINGRGQGDDDWAGVPGAPSYAEQLVVRGSLAAAEPVPTTGQLAMIILILMIGTLAAFGLRRARNT